MPASLKIIAWSMLGAILGFALVGGGFKAYYLAFDPVVANEIRAWQDFIAMMMGGAGAGVSFFAGLVFGLFAGKKREIK